MDIQDSIYVRAAIDHAMGTNYALVKRNSKKKAFYTAEDFKTPLPVGLVRAWRDGEAAGHIPTRDGVTIGEMARGFLAARQAYLDRLANS